MSNLDDESLKVQVEEQLVQGSASKRAREVARIILERDSCTTSDLEDLGYKHSPRAVRDLREAGINVETIQESYTDQTTGLQKRRARYAIVGTDPNRTSRRPFSKKVTETVKESGRCEICGTMGKLQVDHRIPFEVGGETYPHLLGELIPLCPSCNRAKSWTCEHCPNWITRNVNICKTCMWASPKNYEHVAEKEVRELRAVLNDLEDIELYDTYKPDLQRVVHEWLRARR